MARKGQGQQGASLREAAAELGITRARLLKLLERGLPSTLVRERRMVDVAAARAWMEAHAAEPVAPARAAELHPDDIRHREKTAAARLSSLKLSEKQGHMIRIADVTGRTVESFVVLNSRLNALHAMCGNLAVIDRGNAAAIIGDGVAQVLETFAPDDADAFPESPFEFTAGDDDSEFESRVYLPIMPDSDPRALVAAVNLRKHEAALVELERGLITTADAQRIVTEKAEAIRKRVRAIPARVAKRLADSDNPAHFVRDVLAAEVESAKFDAVVICGGKPDWQPSPPVALDVLDAGPLDDVDGDASADEFEAA